MAEVIVAACAHACACDCEAPTDAYMEWLAAADRAIARGLNANGVWRIHERFGRNCRGYTYDLGGEG